MVSSIEVQINLAAVVAAMSRLSNAGYHVASGATKNPQHFVVLGASPFLVGGCFASSEPFSKLRYPLRFAFGFSAHAHPLLSAKQLPYGFGPHLFGSVAVCGVWNPDTSKVRFREQPV